MVVVPHDAVGGQTVDAAGRLRVQQDGRSSDAVRRSEGLVVQEPTGDGPPLVLVVRAGRALQRIAGALMPAGAHLRRTAHWTKAEHFFGARAWC